jgi:DNA-binding transcriptional MocR family regulator
MHDLTGVPQAWPGGLRAVWERALAGASHSPGGCDTPPARGEPALLSALSALLEAASERLIVTSSVRAAAVVLASRCATAFVERPTFTDIPELFASLGLPVRCLDWHDLAAACAGQHRPMVWVTSPARNPDGATLDPRLLSHLRDTVAEQGGVMVVNETYRWYARPAVPPGCVRVGSLSKLAGGGTRIGWVIEPPPEAAKALCRLGPATIWQRAWAGFLRMAGRRRLVDGFIHPVTAARDAFTAEVNGCVEGSYLAGAGPSVFLPLGEAVPEARATSLLGGHGIRVGAGADFLAARPSIRLAFTGLAPGQPREAGRAFAALVRAHPWLLSA